jgi:hypothetical protein
MPYHIKKPGLPLNAGIGDVYYVGGLQWDNTYANRKVYSSKATADARIANPDGTNGGFVNATVITE